MKKEKPAGGIPWYPYAALMICLVLLVLLKAWNKIIKLILSAVVFLLAGWCLFVREKKKKPLTVIRTREDVLSQIRSVRNTAVFLDVVSFFTLGRYPKGEKHRAAWRKDVEDILHFDKLLSKGEAEEFPPMRTEEGKTIWKAYMVAGLMERLTPEQKVLMDGGWLCTCGRANPAYTSTCVCGVNKRSVPQPKEEPKELPKSKPPVPTHWRCTCGRENPNYTSTCVCGVNKRDAQNIPQ